MGIKNTNEISNIDEFLKEVRDISRKQFKWLNRKQKVLKPEKPSL